MKNEIVVKIREEYKYKILEMIEGDRAIDEEILNEANRYELVEAIIEYSMEDKPKEEFNKYKHYLVFNTI